MLFHEAGALLASRFQDVEYRAAIQASEPFNGANADAFDKHFNHAVRLAFVNAHIVQWTLWNFAESALALFTAPALIAILKPESECL